MNTLLTESPETAAGFIKNGGICAFPTETVYGLGANVFDAPAIAKIFEAKQRPADNPLIAHVATRDQIELLAGEISESAERFITTFFPGPLTLVLPKSDKVPLIATAGLDTIGVRMPSLRLAKTFLTACGTPVVAPSANLSGRPSPTTWKAVAEDLDGRIDCILQSDQTVIGLESTVVDCTGEVPVLLRQGAVSLADLRAVIAETTSLLTDPALEKRSPGLRHRHYSPTANVVVLRPDVVPDSPETAAYIGVTQQTLPFRESLVCVSVEAYAHEVFEFFRVCDRHGIATIYCEAVEETGIGAALMDRLRRAADG